MYLWMRSFMTKCRDYVTSNFRKSTQSLSNTQNPYACLVNREKLFQTKEGLSILTLVGLIITKFSQ